jgi:RNA polymerase sigma-70 factor (ECF subfamily)
VSSGRLVPDEKSAEQSAEALAERFEELRPQLVGAAYRILGTVADAEDAVQETWLRWADLGPSRRSAVRDPRAYLLTVATRQALNRVRQQQNRREDYVGPWLPEPVATDRGPAESVELADSVSMAMLVVLESLSPLERAAFVLHDVFGLSFAEVASTLDRSEAAVRQLANRARGHVHSRRPEVVDRKRHDAVLDQFVEHLAAGNMEKFMALLAPDVVLVTDGGGIKRAARRPIHGPDKVVRWMAGVLARPEYADVVMTVEMARLNDERAVLVYANGELDTVSFLTVEERGITALYVVRNPSKLTGITGEVTTVVD